jgi:hypothetical protein
MSEVEHYGWYRPAFRVPREIVWLGAAAIALPAYGALLTLILRAPAPCECDCPQPAVEDQPAPPLTSGNRWISGAML